MWLGVALRMDIKHTCVQERLDICSKNDNRFRLYRSTIAGSCKNNSQIKN
jgi:hypothetical protein